MHFFCEADCLDAQGFYFVMPMRMEELESQTARINTKQSASGLVASKA